MLACLALFIRTFCAVIIIGQLDRSPTDLDNLQRARDITYGLFSSAFVVPILFCWPSKTKDDPLAVQKEEAKQAKKDAQVASDTAVEEYRGSLMHKLDEITESGKKTAPTVFAFLQDMESELVANDIHSAVKKEELERLKVLYEEWEPIFKFSKDK